MFAERNCPGLRLLGFLDPDNIPVEHFVRHSLFIYPDEKVRLHAQGVAACISQSA